MSYYSQRLVGEIIVHRKRLTEMSRYTLCVLELLGLPFIALSQVEIDQTRRSPSCRTLFPVTVTLHDKITI